VSRQDYIRIARALNATYRSAIETKQSADVLEAILRTAYSIASELAEDNSRFNAHHFMDVVRGCKEITSHPPRNDSRSMQYGRLPKVGA